MWTRILVLSSSLVGLMACTPFLAPQPLAVLSDAPPEQERQADSTPSVEVLRHVPLTPIALVQPPPALVETASLAPTYAPAGVALVEAPSLLVRPRPTPSPVVLIQDASAFAAQRVRG